MSDPFLGQISMFGFSFAPRGWLLCDGQTLPISQYSALFSLLGTTYGGNGETTFGLPDLRGRVPIHEGRGPGLSQRTLGERAGAPTHTLSVAELPNHAHTARGSSDPATETVPDGTRVLAHSVGAQLYGAPTDLAGGAGAAGAGGGQPHINEQPFLVLSFCIAVQGIFPSES